MWHQHPYCLCENFLKVDIHPLAPIQGHDIGVYNPTTQGTSPGKIFVSISYIGSKIKSNEHPLALRDGALGTWE